VAKVAKVAKAPGKASAPGKSAAKPIAAKRAAAATAAKPAPPAPAAKPAPATKPAPAARSAKPAPAAPTAPTAPAARFTFEARPVIRDPQALTPLVRQQLVQDTLLATGRTTTPDRVPRTYFALGIHRWRIGEGKKPLFDIVQNTAFIADTDEPAGLERVAGSWRATGRGAIRGLTFDLPHLAWELDRDWPGRRLPLGPEPAPNTRVVVEPIVRDQPWPPDAEFV
ncbi:MAG: hypothetical protein K8W52_38260, partial [Deltaproteobacteria bacterium]|nr:hypothetical protein [Deltaproteobacteria bacterium]